MFRNGSSLIMLADHPALLNLPYELPAEYQLDMTAKRLSGGDMLGMRLSVGGRPFSVRFRLSRMHRHQ